MSQEFLTLTDSQIFEISLLESGRRYKNGQRAEEKKTYSRFRYNGIVFTVDDSNPFITDYNNKTVQSVKLAQGTRTVTNVDSEGNEVESTVGSLAFDSYINFSAQSNLLQHQANMAQYSAKIDRFRKLANAPVDESALAALMS